MRATNKKRVPVPLLIACLWFIATGMPLGSRGAHASVDGLTKTEIDFLKDVDTILFDETYEYEAGKLIAIPHNELRPVIDAALQEVVKGNSWITSGPVWVHTAGRAHRPLREELEKPNVAHLTLTISAREVEGDNGEPVRVGAITASLYSHHKDEWFPFVDVSIPFVLSSDKTETLRRIQDAVEILTGHLPGFMRCARQLEPYYCGKDQYKFLEKQNELQ